MNRHFAYKLSFHSKMFLAAFGMAAVIAPIVFGHGNAAQNSANPVSITDADEIRVGQFLAKQYDQQMGIQSTPQSKKIEEYLQIVGDKVAAHAQRKLPYRFHFDPNPNFKSGIGLPGGEVLIGGGILSFMDTEDQLAAVLGHEVEHVALNHCRDRLVKIIQEQRLSVEKPDKLKYGDFGSSYGHDPELAADLGGVKLAMEAGYSSQGAIRLLKTFLILQQQMPNAIEDRKRIEDRIAQLEPLGKTSKTQASEKPLAIPW